MSVPILGSGTGNPLSASETHTNSDCATHPGSATISATGGTEPYTGTGTFPQLPGMHTYTVTDGAGCTTTVQVTVTYTDNVLPSLTCPTSTSVNPNTGACTYTIVGTAYNPTGVSDNCAVASQTNNFNSMATLNGAVLNAGPHTIMWTVTDVNGLMNTCQFTLTVTECVEISGTVFWKGDGVAGVNNVNVALTGDATGTDASDANGDYELVASTGTNFVITPSKNTGGMFNGVTAADATVIQQHLTGTNIITDFYRLVAADCNKSNNISSVDAALIRQGLLGNSSALAILNTTKAWRFVRTGYTPVLGGPYMLDHHSLYSTRVLTGVSGMVPGQDFYGIKTGDVFEESNPGVDIADPSLKPDPTAKPLVWRVRDRVLQAGQTVDLDFSVVNFTDIAAFQHGMRFDPTVLEFQNVTVTNTNISLDAEGNFGTYQIAAGELRTLWSVAQGSTLPGVQPMYRVRFKVLRSGMKVSDVLSFDPAVLAATAYTTDLAQRQVQLVFADYKNTGLPKIGDPAWTADSGFDLLQNRPNPFSDRTAIGFILPSACDAQLRVFDLSGRELWRSDKSYPAGYSEEIIRFDDLGTAAGMLFYELTTPQGKQTRKMQVVKE
ncbi:MAG: T9SS type A sorting domain-containing protein [Saprospiraceae bacterium]